MPGILNATKLDVALTLLDSLADELCRSSFTLGTDDSRLFLLPSLVDKECRPLGLLLCDLFGFDGSCKFGREGQVLCVKN